MLMIGIDPHKGSHTAAAVDRAEAVIDTIRVDADRPQRARLLAWAAPFSPRTWAIEGATGMGALLAQQLVAAGEHVVDVPPKLSSRVRLLERGKIDKTDPNNSRSAAIVAWHNPLLNVVTGLDEHRVVLRLNHAIHMAAVTQVGHVTAGRVYYLRKQAEGRTRKEALRALKRQLSDAVYQRLIDDTRN